jgi:hypothetical protein
VIYDAPAALYQAKAVKETPCGSSFFWSGGQRDGNA